MADIKKWALPETTKKPVFEGIYPAVISMSKLFTKEVEKDDKKFQREIVSLTFTTLTEVPFPDKTNGKITVEQQYYFDVPFHVNALNGIARAARVPKLLDTDELESKTVMIGIINETFQTRDGEEVTVPKFGFGLFTYAPMSEKSEIKFIANDFPNGDISEEDYKKWFKDNIALFKEPK
jgi:hypothetical protein